MAGLLFASRAGSAITAEIGLMKTTEQLSAMEMMAVDPLARVVAPNLPEAEALSGIQITSKDTLQVSELYVVSNSSSPPRTLSGDQTFQIELPPGAQVDGSIAEIGAIPPEAELQNPPCPYWCRS